MKISYLALAATLAATATGAFAETGVKIGQTDHVANVYGRAGVPNVRIAGTVVTRPSEEVPSGPTTVEGPTALATMTRNPDVNEVHGRS
jgi:hypothetical protein